MVTGKQLGSKSTKTLFSDQVKEKKKATANLARGSFYGSYEADSVDYPRSERQHPLELAERKEKPRPTRYIERREFTIFAYTEYHDRKKVEEEIKQVRAELYQVIKEMEKLGADVKEAQRAVMEEITAPGIYHLNFFEKLKTLLKVLRQNIQESRNWLEMVFARKRKRRYWFMAKKGGSMFTMSHERRLATQAG